MVNRTRRVLRCVAAAWAVVFFIGASFRVLADCASFGLPFTDLGSEPTSFCAVIAAAYYAGITAGTSATTFSPSSPVTRDQAVAFTVNAMNASLARGSRRAALDQWWTQTPHFDLSGLGLTSTGTGPQLLKSDGTDIWVANFTSATVSRVQASDGRKLEDWTGATKAVGVLVAMGRVFVTGDSNPGVLFGIDPSATAGAVTTLVGTLGSDPAGIAFDGNKIWTANQGGSVSIITPTSTTPWSVNTVTGFNSPTGAIFDGSNIWVTDASAGTLLKLDSNGAVLQTVTVGTTPEFPAFDGHNIWVPNHGSGSLTVVRASDGTVLKTFSAANGTQNGLSSPLQAAFDGERILVANQGGTGLSLFKATDLSIIGNLSAVGLIQPSGVCSDGINFWVTFNGSGKIGRF